jgi:hypothetical protein
MIKYPYTVGMKQTFLPNKYSASRKKTGGVTENRSMDRLPVSVRH